MSLTEEQQYAVDIALSGVNLFLTSSAGCGKSFTIQYIIDRLTEKGKKYVLTASTGSASYLIGGCTIHSYVGLGVPKRDPEYYIPKVLASDSLSQRWKIDTLIIDEISLLSIDYFVLLDRIAKAVRESTLPFGGIQIILVGDFLQLPPIGLSSDGYRFIFQHPIWQTLNLTTVVLKKSMRQSDSTFTSILNNIRYGIIDSNVLSILDKCKNTTFPNDGILPTMLYGTNKDVDFYNNKYLSELEGDEHIFNVSTDLKYVDEYDIIYNDTQKEINTTIVDNYISNIPDYIKVIKLKVGAQVIFTRNDKATGFYNGMRGVVVKFASHKDVLYPVVRTTEGNKVLVQPYPNKHKIGDFCRITVLQIPLRLGWATTIHKCQGMTLSRVVCDLTTVFEHGQGYVVLSRVKSIDSLKIIKYKKSTLTSHPDAIDFYKNLENT